jgi:DNA mismatch repair protein MutS
LSAGSLGISQVSLTPALRQYVETKALNPDSFLFFQVGDFFELFFDDAVEVSSLLDLTLTSRQKIDGVPVPMCGVPLAAADAYINRLASLGHKVSVCEQESLPLPGEKVAKRRLTRIVTPGTILSQEEGDPSGRFLALALRYPLEGSPGHPLGASQKPASDDPNDPTSHNPNAPSHDPIKSAPNAAPTVNSPIGPAWYLASIDLSTGDFDLAKGDGLQDILGELARMGPKELLCVAEPPQDLSEHAGRAGIFLSVIRPDPDPMGQLGGTLREDTPAGGADGISQEPGAILAAGTLLGYLRTLAPGADLGHLGSPRLLWRGRHLGLDEAAIRNLELVSSLRDQGREGTLLGLLDKAQTPMGSRLIKAWLTWPLSEREGIELRHEALGELIGQSLLRDNMASLLKGAKDLERGMARLALGRGGVRDLLLVREALRLAPMLRDLLGNASSRLLAEIAGGLNPPEGLARLLEGSLRDPSGLPPGSPEGAYLPEGLSPALDSLRELESGGRRKIAEIAAEEKQKTGIHNLRVGHTRVFGYYLELGRNQLGKVPPNWQRKQTLSTSERYVTPELLSWEERILTAGEKRATLEERILANLKRRVAREARAVRALASGLASLDALCSLATVSQRHGWVRPELCEDDVLEIRGGSHPVVEASLPKGEDFVTNDVTINQRERILVITGPNMSGKSTILRQTALIVILCQMGCFVPAKSARLSLRDHVFTRVGAADDLTRGRSTFMVEMSETARILRKATSRSLVILDEVGRGTSTFDGLAIAWAVAEYLHDRDGRGVPTLFATHYHELIDLARHKPLAVNHNVSVKKWEGKVVFLRKLMPGGTSKSYGLAVAALAGLPRKVMRRASEVLSDLMEGAEKSIRPEIRPAGLFPELATIPRGAGPPGELPAPALRLINDLRDLNPDSLTPLEGLNLLSELRARAKDLPL